jgi:hypothetical protein
LFSKSERLCTALFTEAIRCQSIKSSNDSFYVGLILSVAHPRMSGESRSYEVDHSGYGHPIGEDRIPYSINFIDNDMDDDSEGVRSVDVTRYI